MAGYLKSPMRDTPADIRPASPYFKVPADFSVQSISLLARINEGARYPIREVYGSIPELSASARPSNVLPAVDKSDFGKYVHTLRDCGIEFNYVYNLPTVRCLNEVKSLIALLRNWNVRHITIADQTKVSAFADAGFQVTYSIVRGVKSVHEMKALPCLNELAGICLHEDINRNLRVLTELRMARPSIRLEVIVNNLCLLNCPRRGEHYEAIASGQRTESEQFGKACEKTKREHPVEVLRAQWITPKLLPKYEAIGIDVFKIAGRERINPGSYPFIAAYAKAQYDGEFFPLFLLGKPSDRGNLTDISCQALDEFLAALLDSGVECSRTHCRECLFCEKWAGILQLQPPDVLSRTQRTTSA